MTTALAVLVGLLAALLAVAAWAAVFLARNAKREVSELQHQIHLLEAGDYTETVQHLGIGEVEWNTE